MKEMNHDKLLSVPPLNDKCLYAPQNILIVNRKGEAIMVEPKRDEESTCTIFNKVLKDPEFPFSHRIISTVSTRNVNMKGNPPKSKFNIKTGESISKGAAKYMANRDTMDETRAKHGNLFDFHKNQAKAYHQNIKNNIDSYRHYFCEFNDDFDERVDLAEYGVVYDVAKNMYPQTVLDSTSNKRKHSLDYKIITSTKPVIDHNVSPNVVYVKNIGFVSLLPICDGTPLILKNSTVYLQNLIRRDNKNLNFITKDSESCKYKGDDDDDLTQTFVSVNVGSIPKRKKSDLPGLVKLCGNNLKFDDQAYMRMQKCNTPNFNEFANKYSNNSDTIGCLKDI